MKQSLDLLRLSATDLANHLACRHLTTLDRAVAEGRAAKPDWNRPDAEILRVRGLEHEAAYLVHLERLGRTITRLDESDDGGAIEKAIAAMRACSRTRP